MFSFLCTLPYVKCYKIQGPAYLHLVAYVFFPLFVMAHTVTLKWLGEECVMQ
jgi:hypothetical protein